MPTATRRKKKAARKRTRSSAKSTGTSKSAVRRPTKKKKKKAKREKKVSRTHKPDELSLEQWQRVLRRQYGRDQDFQWENVGTEPIFSQFRVTNANSKSSYRVVIRGQELGANFCSCPDFLTNALGTCKHIEFVLGRLEKKRGGKKAFAEGYLPPFSEVYVQYGAQRRVRFHAGEECPPKLARLASEYFDDEGFLKPKSAHRFQQFLSDAAEIDHDLRTYDDALDLVAEMRDADERKRRLRKAFPKGAESSRFDKLLNVSLYKYQREGALFAASAGRSLIGDEMGLGKTIQAIAAAEIMAKDLGVERVLIVCPTSLKYQWATEIKKFTKRDALIVEGPLDQWAKQFETDCFFHITNYDTVHRDLGAIHDLRPDLVILDEAQRIKNWDTRTARSVKQIRSPYCVVLTGTPLENRLEELISIVQFIDQHRLGPTYRVLDEHQVKDDNGRVVGYQHLNKLGKTLEPILLRRQKKEVVQELPNRLDKNLFVPMTEQQQNYHEENRETVARLALKWRRQRFLTEADQRRLMISLQNMRMACDSTYLLDKETDHSTKPDELAIQLDELLEQDSTKVVIFSQWTRMHELIRRRMQGKPYEHVLFHGGVPSKKRKDLVSQFKEDPKCRVFLATDAGGVGLNLQHANVVINMDLPWNPAVLEQRIGRAHRLGQTQPVQVINYVSQGTIEHSMLSTLAFKKSLFAGVLDGGENEVFLGESRLKKFMETVEKVNEGIGENTMQRPEADQNGATESSERSVAKASDKAAADDPLSTFLNSGMQLLQQFASVAAGQDGGLKSGGATRSPFPVETSVDESTGQAFMKVPMPDSETLNRAAAALNGILAAMRQ